MKVKELVKICYDDLVIYEPANKEFTEFKDLFHGKREEIPGDLLEREVQCLGAKQEKEIEIQV